MPYQIDMSPQRISLMAVRSALGRCKGGNYPAFNYGRLFIRDSGGGWFEQRHRFAFGKEI